METKLDRGSFLIRLGGSKECYVLEQSKNIHLGRADTCEIPLKESTAISRRHALLQPLPGGNWAITDLKSSNGVYVNNEKIPVGFPWTLQDQDVVEIGRDVRNSNQAAYTFQFYKHAKVVKQDQMSNDGQGSSIPKPRGAPPSLLSDKHRNMERWLVQDMAAEMTEKISEKERQHDALLQQMATLQEELDGKMKQQLEREETLRIQQEEYKERLLMMQQENDEKESELRDLLLETTSDKRTMEERMNAVKADLQQQIQKQEEEKRQLAAHEALRVRHLDETSQQLAAHQQMLRQYEQEQTKLKREMQQQLNQERARVQHQKTEHEAERVRLQELLAEQMRQREAQLKQKMEDEITSLKQQKDQMEATLKERSSQEEALRETIGKEKKTEIVSSLEDLVESELVCAICSELFVKATSLNCSHSFCSLCIEKWMEKKKECPNCRQKIKSYVPSLVLDNYISNLMGLLSDEMRQHYSEILVDREGEQKEWNAQKAAEAARKAAESQQNNLQGQVLQAMQQVFGAARPQVTPTHHQVQAAAPAAPSRPHQLHHQHRHGDQATARNHGHNEQQMDRNHGHQARHHGNHGYQHWTYQNRYHNYGQGYYYNGGYHQ